MLDIGTLVVSSFMYLFQHFECVVPWHSDNVSHEMSAVGLIGVNFHVMIHSFFAFSILSLFFAFRVLTVMSLDVDLLTFTLFEIR